jgi:hypothetical protein
MMLKLAALISMVGIISCVRQNGLEQIQVCAYSRSTIAASQEGMRPMPAVPEEIINYFIYLEQVDPGMSVKTIWINRIHYRATLQRADLPVTFESGGTGPGKHIDTVFRASSRLVFRVIPGEIIAAGSIGRKKKLAQENAVLLEIESGGRNLLGISREFKKLNPIVLQ